MDPEKSLSVDHDDDNALPSPPRRLSHSPDMAAAVQQMPQPLFQPPSSSPTTASQPIPGATKRYRPAPAKTFQCRGYGECRMVFSRSEHLARHIRYVFSPYFPLFLFFFFSSLRDNEPSFVVPDDDVAAQTRLATPLRAV